MWTVQRKREVGKVEHCSRDKSREVAAPGLNMRSAELHDFLAGTMLGNDTDLCPVPG